MVRMHTRLVVTCVALVLFAFGCSHAPSEPDGGPARDAQSDSDWGTDLGACEPPSPPVPLAACDTVPTRTGETTGRENVGTGSADVVAIETIDGRVHLSLEQDGIRRVLVLPAAPPLVEGDTVEIEAEGAALTVSHEGTFVAFAGGEVPSGALTDLMRLATDMGSAPVSIGDVDVVIEAACASARPHRDPRFCPDVGLVAFGLRFGDTRVLAGESVELVHGGRDLAVAIESLTRRDDRYSGTCAGCGDYWPPSFDVALVPLTEP